MFDLKSLEIEKDVVRQLEQALETYLGFDHVVAVENETVAFRACLERFQQDDEVFCSPVATHALHRALSELSLKSLYTDLRLDATTETRFLERQLTEKSKCFVLSHYQGVSSSVEDVQNFCAQHKLSFVEDATHSFYQYKKSSAKIVVFSLDSLIDSQIAQGAFIATDDLSLAQTLRSRVQGGYQKRKNWNYDLLNKDKNVQLSVLNAHFALKHLEGVVEKKQKVQKIQMQYKETLSGVKLLTLPAQNNLSSERSFSVILDPSLFCPKEDIYSELLDAGIAVKVGLKPVYKTKAFLDESVQLFGVEEIYKGILLLPIDSEMSESNVRIVIETFKEILDKYAYRGCSF